MFCASITFVLWENSYAPLTLFKLDPSEEANCGCSCTFLFYQILMSVLLGVFATRMQSVWTYQAAMSVPASLATLVMDIHVWTLMSVLLILAMRMQLVLTIMEASPVSVTMDFQEMEHHAAVGLSSSFKNMLISRIGFMQILMSVLRDRTTAQ